MIIFYWQECGKIVAININIVKEVGSSRAGFWLSSDDAGKSVGVVPIGGEDYHLVGGTVGKTELVTEPSEKPWQRDVECWLWEAWQTFLWVCQLFPPVRPVPRYLTEATVDPQTDGDWNDPERVEQEDTGRHK